MNNTLVIYLKEISLLLQNIVGSLIAYVLFSQIFKHNSVLLGKCQGLITERDQSPMMLYGLIKGEAENCCLRSYSAHVTVVVTPNQEWVCIKDSEISSHRHVNPNIYIALLL